MTPACDLFQQDDDFALNDSANFTRRVKSSSALSVWVMYQVYKVKECLPPCISVSSPQVLRHWTYLLLR